MNKNKKRVWHYRIYALMTRDDKVYIGKTMGKKMSAVYRHHTKGRCDHTSKTIGQAGEGTQMYVLEAIEACTSIAYRHVVAWVHIFLCEGYQVVNQQGIVEDAEDLHPETMQLVEELLGIPLAERLLSSRLVRPADADLPDEHRASRKIDSPTSAPQNTSKSATTQLCIRLTLEEKTRLSDYAARMGMTQRDAVMYLLEKHGRPMWGTREWREDQHTLKSQRQAHKTIQRLKDEKEMLEAKLEKVKTENPEIVAPKMTARYRSMQEFLGKYFEKQSPSVGELRPLPRWGYKRFMRSLQPGMRYDYPQDEGIYVFEPQAILYGEARPPVRFWVGLLENGSFCKLRLYEKWDYVGVSPGHKDYAVQGMRWLIRVRRAADGAMDLVAAMPLGKEERAMMRGTKVSLAQRIAEIED